LIERTSTAALGQAFMLDESFESMNTRVSKSSEFLKLINHLQLIRQKGLFVILCLPNFFDLSKTIAVFRTSHLFVVYHDSFKRGFFAAFGRETKRQLYIKGNKFLNYNAEEPNFRGRFVKKWIADENLYLKLKENHLIEQSKDKTPHFLKKSEISRNKIIRFMFSEGYRVKKIMEVSDMSRQGIYNIINEGKSESE
jgi:hypothetical protein